MLEFIFNILRELGWIGLIAGIAVEALSIPFPAAIIFLIYGYLIGPTGWDLIWISVIASAAYTVIAYIPYYLSNRFQGFVQRRLVSRRAKRMVRFMKKYRGWTIAAGRVLGMGYIVYVAAFCKITPLRYGFFTFIGVFPVAVVMLYLGTLGVVGEAYGVFQNVQYLIALLFAAVVIYYIYYRVKTKKKAENVPSRAR